MHAGDPCRDAEGADIAEDGGAPQQNAPQQNGPSSVDAATDVMCPLPTIAPRFELDAPAFCPDDTTYDASYRLCVGADVAIGPFTPQMAADCEACGGVGCDDAQWPADQARGLRGSAICPPGATYLERLDLCVDEDSAWGPFDQERVKRCIEKGGGMSACQSMRWNRKFAEGIATPLDSPPTGSSSARSWRYILPKNLGIRSDSAGAGHFGASRSGNGGGHSGVDLLVPVGTPLLSPCEGDAESGVASGYGNYVKLVCPIPSDLTDAATYFVSVFFAHLSAIDIASGAHVEAGQQVGKVGKTGNAAGASVMPHVHFEIAVHGSRQEAWNESHASSNHASNSAADAFFPALSSHCLDPLALSPRTGPVRKGRRPDPLLMLFCLADNRPQRSAPPASLARYSETFSQHYQANFDVDSSS
jgi:hypothetical protein